MNPAVNLRVGIIGLGRIGHAFGVSVLGDPLSHSEAYARIEHVEVAWGVDPDSERRAGFSARFPAAAAFAEATGIADPRVDVVSICTPTPAHGASVDIALRLGARVVVCEKPLAATAREAQTIVDRCHAAGSILLVNYTRRFAPMLECLRSEASDGGTLSGPITGSIRYNGGFIHSGTHWIDLCRAIFGDVLYARNASLEHNTGQDLPRTALFTFAGDRAVTLVGIDGNNYSVGEGEFFASRGAIRFRDGGETVTSVSTIESPAWPGYRTLSSDRTLIANGLRGHLDALARHAVALAREGGAPKCSGEDGVSALRAAEAALAS